MESIPEYNFRVQALNGDLIMFNTKNIMSRVQRSVTNSDYDHVGMVIRIKSDPSEIYILEAVSTGVRLNQWSLIRNCVSTPRSLDQRYYQKAAFRHVNFPRTKKFNDDI